MIAYLTLIIPALTVLVLFFMYRKETCLWEYAVVMGPSILFVVVLKFSMIKYNESDTEYLGEYVTHVQHYDHWDEWIKKTCSYTTCSGSGKTRSCTTHYYDCSYRQDHPEHWVKVTNTGRELEISEYEYRSLAKRFNTQEQFVEMNRHYYRIDGDAQRYNYNQEINRIETVVLEHSYDNVVKASSSVFKFEDISESEVSKWKLYDYPEVTSYKQPIVLGYPVYAVAQRKLEYINGMLGTTKQVHLFILVYHNKPHRVVNKQLSYWQGGNKNELIIHVGLNKSNEIIWADANSWMDKPEVTTRIKSYLNDKKHLDLNQLADFLIPTIESHWHRKSFSDFDYIDLELSPTQLSWITVLLLIYNVGIAIWVVKNEHLNAC